MSRVTPVKWSWMYPATRDMIRHVMEDSSNHEKGI